MPPKAAKAKSAPRTPRTPGASRPTTPSPQKAPTTPAGDAQTPTMALREIEENSTVIPMRQLQTGEEIGKGRFKKVLRGKYKNQEAVVLRYAKDASNTNELRILALLAKQGQTSFVPWMYGICHDKNTALVIQEIARGGALKTVITEPVAGFKVTGDHLLFAALGAAKAMQFLQSVHVVHADLSCRNILVFEINENPGSTTVKVSDFGLSIVLPEGAEEAVKRQPRAVRWCAPETVLESKYSARSDCWALATTFWESLTNGTAPWVNRPKRADVQDTLRAMGESPTSSWDLSEDFPEPDGCPMHLYRVMLSMLSPSEYSRPTMDQIVQRLEAISHGEDPTKLPSATPPTTCAASTDEQNQAISDRRQSLPGEEDPWARMKTFLSSEKAARMLDEEALAGLWEELDAARSRETELQSRPPPTATAPVSAPQSAPQSIYDRESLPPASARTPRRAQGPFTLWTCSLAGTLGRQDFFNENEALEAFCLADGPKMLRDPTGAEVVAKNWRAAYFLHPVATVHSAVVRAWSPRSPRSSTGIGRSYMGLSQV